MKISAEELFEKDQPVDDAQLAQLETVRNRLRVAFGVAITLILLIPELIDIETPVAPLLLLALFLFGIGQALALLLAKKWKRVPIAERRLPIVHSFAISLVVFAFIPGMSIFTGDEEAFPAFVVLGLLAYGLYRLNKRWQRGREDDELFP